MELHAIECLSGPNLLLRLIQLSDAKYAYDLRTNPLYNQNLSKVTGSVEDQRQWLKGYKAREAKLQELYYVIERMDRIPCGLVRLYDITDDAFTWGSWVLDENKPRKAALESALLSFELGFNIIDKAEAFIEVRLENERAISFYRRFGMTQMKKDLKSIYFKYTREHFNENYEAYMSILHAEVC